MIVGVGVDVIAVDRLAAALRRHGARFLARCFAAREAVALDEPERAAAFFAVKEAALKALGTGWAAGLGFRDVAVVETAGLHGIELSGEAARRAAAMGVTRCHVTGACRGAWAVAMVVLEREPPHPTRA